jgi:hypothetical protein
VLPRRLFRFPLPATFDISVIVPVLDEAGSIAACLDSILEQEIGALTIEVLVADGGSTDGTREIIEARARRDPRVRLIENPGRRVSPALNAGLAASRGRIIARMDAHALYAPDYLRESVRLLESSGAAAVGGIQVPAPGGTGRMAMAIAAFQEGRLGLGGGRHRRPGYEGPAETLWLGTFRRETVETVGLFDAALFRSEDNDFFQRVRAAGGRLLASASIRARYVCRPTLRGLVRQCQVTGSEIFPTLRRNPRALAARHLVPGAALVAGVMLLALTLFTRGGAPLALLAAAGGIYAALVLAAAAGAARRHGMAILPALLVVFPAAHLAYAAGTLAGLIALPAAPRRGARPDRLPIHD